MSERVDFVKSNDGLPEPETPIKRNARSAAIGELNASHKLIQLDGERKEITEIINDVGLLEFWEMINRLNRTRLSVNNNNSKRAISNDNLERYSGVSDEDLERFSVIVEKAKKGYDYFNDTVNQDYDTISFDDMVRLEGKCDELEAATYPSNEVPGPMPKWPSRQ